MVFKNKTITLFDLPGRACDANPSAGILGIVSFLEDKKIKCDYYDLSSNVFANLDKKINMLFNELEKSLINEKKRLYRLKNRLLISSFFKFVSANKKITGGEKIELSLFFRRFYLYSIIFGCGTHYFDNLDVLKHYNRFKFKSKYFFRFELWYLFALLLGISIRKRKFHLELQKLVLNDPEFVNFLYEKVAKADIIGLSLNWYNQVGALKEVSRLIKKKFPSKKIVVGGHHATVQFHGGQLDKSFFRYIDYLIIEEGELPIYRLIQHLEGKIKINEVPNLVHQKMGKIIVNEKEFYSDLDKLPVSAYYKIDTSRYFEKRLFYETNRGCSWGRCSFCSVISSKCSPPVRCKSGKKICKDLIYLKRLTGINRFWLVNLELPVQLAIQMSKEFIKRNVDIRWQSYMRFEDDLDSSTLKLMREAGCAMLNFGLESGSSKINRMINKGVRLDSAERILEDCKKLGIKTQLYTVWAFPNESIKDTLHGFKFIHKNIKNIDALRIMKFKLWPQTPMYHQPYLYGINHIEQNNGNITFVADKHNFYRKYCLRVLLFLYFHYLDIKYKDTLLFGCGCFW